MGFWAGGFVAAKEVKGTANEKGSAPRFPLLFQPALNSMASSCFPYADERFAITFR
jgi:hypothetical protein